MTEYIDGLYTIMSGTCADILYQGEISTGYNRDGPLFTHCIDRFFTNRSRVWSNDPSIIMRYWKTPKLIAPINLIKWED